MPESRALDSVVGTRTVLSLVTGSCLPKFMLRPLVIAVLISLDLEVSVDWPPFFLLSPCTPAGHLRYQPSVQSNLLTSSRSLFIRKVT